MGSFSQQDWDQFILEQAVIGLFDEEKVLKSKRKSHWYVNWRKPSSSGNHLDEMARNVVAFARDNGYRDVTFHGVPQGATKLGIATQLRKREDGQRLVNDLVYRAPNANLSAVQLEDLAKEIHVLTAGHFPDSYVAIQADNPVRDLTIATQYDLVTLHVSNSGDFPFPQLRSGVKSHGDTKDKQWLGKPSGSTVLVVDPRTLDGELDLSSLPSDVKIEAVVYTGDIPTCHPKYIAGREISAYSVSPLTIERRNPDSLVLLEDVTTTGGSALKYAHQQGGSGINIAAVVSLTNREECVPIPGVDDAGVVIGFNEIFDQAARRDYVSFLGVRNNRVSVPEVFQTAGIPYYAMSSARTLLPRLKMSGQMAKRIEKEFTQYGTQPLNLRGEQ